MKSGKDVSLTDDTLKNILIMAPMLDEVGQNRVFGLMCGLLASGGENHMGKETSPAKGDQRAG